MMNFKLDSKLKLWILVFLTMLVPGSGYVLIGKPIRGLIMLMWMFVFGYITMQLTNESISFIGRLSGGFAVWAISITEIYRLGIRLLTNQALMTK